MSTTKGFLITGASSGIGREIALSLAKKNPDSRLWLAGRSEEKLRDLAQYIQITTDCDAVSCVADLERLTRAQAQSLCMGLYDSCDIGGIVHCAGIFKRVEPGFQWFADDAQRLMQVNLLGPMILDSQALISMTHIGRGVLMYVNSTAAIEHRPGNEIYSASKAGLLAYANTLRESVRQHGVRVLTACPGPTWTPAWDGFEQHRERMMSATEVGAELARQMTVAMDGGPVCEQIHLRHISGPI